MQATSDDTTACGKDDSPPPASTTVASPQDETWSATEPPALPPPATVAVPVKPPTMAHRSRTPTARFVKPPRLPAPIQLQPCLDTVHVTPHTQGSGTPTLGSPLPPESTSFTTPSPGLTMPLVRPQPLSPLYGPLNITNVSPAYVSLSGPTSLNATPPSMETPPLAASPRLRSGGDLVTGAATSSALMALRDVDQTVTPEKELALRERIQGSTLRRIQSLHLALQLEQREQLEFMPSLFDNLRMAVTSSSYSTDGMDTLTSAKEHQPTGTYTNQQMLPTSKRPSMTIDSGLHFRASNLSTEEPVPCDWGDDPLVIPEVEEPLLDTLSILPEPSFLPLSPDQDWLLPASALAKEPDHPDASTESPAQPTNCSLLNTEQRSLPHTNWDDSLDPDTISVSRSVSWPDGVPGLSRNNPLRLPDTLPGDSFVRAVALSHWDDLLGPTVDTVWIAENTNLTSTTMSSITKHLLSGELYHSTQQDRLVEPKWVILGAEAFLVAAFLFGNGNHHSYQPKQVLAFYIPADYVTSFKPYALVLFDRGPVLALQLRWLLCHARNRGEALEVFQEVWLVPWLESLKTVSRLSLPTDEVRPQQSLWTVVPPLTHPTARQTLLPNADNKPVVDVELLVVAITSMLQTQGSVVILGKHLSMINTVINTLAVFLNPEQRQLSSHARKHLAYQPDLFLQGFAPDGNFGADMLLESPHPTTVVNLVDRTVAQTCLLPNYLNQRLEYYRHRAPQAIQNYSYLGLNWTTMTGSTGSTLPHPSRRTPTESLVHPPPVTEPIEYPHSTGETLARPLPKTDSGIFRTPGNNVSNPKSPFSLTRISGLGFTMRKDKSSTTARSPVLTKKSQYASSVYQLVTTALRLPGATREKYIRAWRHDLVQRTMLFIQLTTRISNAVGPSSLAQWYPTLQCSDDEDYRILCSQAELLNPGIVLVPPG
ncbi:hypothetical protein IWQ61_006074 [Dispira simplex]|nr:hypothetical protein IWQ61_006074 [Dispira simplex]